MDEKDFQILEILRRDGKCSGPELSKRTGLPLTTVHNRVKRLELTGVIRGYAAVLDEKKMGKTVSAYVLVTVHYPEGKRFSQEDAARKIQALPGVDNVAILAGESDVILKVSSRSIDELNALVTGQLRAITGVEKTHTLVVLNDLTGAR